MSDTPEPHEIPPRSIIGRALRGVTYYDKLCIGPSDADVLAGAVLGALTAAGYVVVKADGLNHGDELETVGFYCEGSHDHPSVSSDAPSTMRSEGFRALHFDRGCPSAEPVWRRSVPENGDTRDALVSSPQWQADVAEAEAAIERGDLGESSTHAELVRRMRQERSER